MDPMQGKEYGYHETLCGDHSGAAQWPFSLIRRRTAQAPGTTSSGLLSQLPK